MKLARNNFKNIHKHFPKSFDINIYSRLSILRNSKLKNGYLTKFN